MERTGFLSSERMDLTVSFVFRGAFPVCMISVMKLEYEVVSVRSWFLVGRHIKRSVTLTKMADS